MEGGSPERTYDRHHVKSEILNSFFTEGYSMFDFIIINCTTTDPLDGKKIMDLEIFLLR